MSVRILQTQLPQVFVVDIAYFELNIKGLTTVLDGIIKLTG